MRPTSNAKEDEEDESSEWREMFENDDASIIEDEEEDLYFDVKMMHEVKHSGEKSASTHWNEQTLSRFIFVCTDRLRSLSTTVTLTLWATPVNGCYIVSLIIQ